MHNELLSFKYRLIGEQGDGLIQGQLLWRDGRMVPQMVRTDFTFKFWSQMSGWVSLGGIFREIEIENIETDTFFSLLLTLFPTSEWKPGMLLCCDCMCVLKKSHKSRCLLLLHHWLHVLQARDPRIGHSRMSWFQLHQELLLRAEALKHQTYQTTSLWWCSLESTGSVRKHELLVCAMSFDAVYYYFHSSVLKWLFQCGILIAKMISDKFSC